MGHEPEAWIRGIFVEHQAGASLTQKNGKGQRVWGAQSRQKNLGNASDAGKSSAVIGGFLIGCRLVLGSDSPHISAEMLKYDEICWSIGRKGEQQDHGCIYWIPHLCLCWYMQDVHFCRYLFPLSQKNNRMAFAWRIFPAATRLFNHGLAPGSCQVQMHHIRVRRKGPGLQVPVIIPERPVLFFKTRFRGKRQKKA